jgi:hypothetical protein
MTLGADLLVLAVDDRRGGVRLERQFGLALAAAELVDLACARRIEAVDGRIHVTESLRTGDPVLDLTLARLAKDPKGIEIGSWVAMWAPDRVVEHLAAMTRSGELSGRLVATSPGATPVSSGIRVADPARREALVRRLLTVARHEVELEEDAYGALAHAADIPVHVLPGPRNWRTRERLRKLAGWFTDTWRYLPGCPEELALGDADVEPGGTNPADEEPWRLLIRLAVGQAVKQAEATTRKSQQDNGLSKDVQTAALLIYTIEHQL